MSRRVSRALLPAALLLVTSCVVLACASGPRAAHADDEGAPLPSWLDGLARAPDLEEAAALLCARDTDGVIDDDARHGARIYDGQVTGLVRRGASLDDAEAQLRAAGPGLARALGASHAGVVVVTANGAPCAALVAARRVVAVDAAPPPTLELGADAGIAAHVVADRVGRVQLYVSGPDGTVSRQEVALRDGALREPLRLTRGEGRYRAELVVERASGPEVALLWPFTVGREREAPFPEVLFPDEGHDDRALTHRAEALVQRLRNEQLLEPLKVAPTLVDVADARAHALAGEGRLGHLVPDGKNAMEALTAKAPQFQVARLVEVQAQASTLADAWSALLQSPAHRFELVQPSVTHFGTAVARGQDGAGRPVVTVVALLARRVPKRDLAQTRAAVLSKLNDARDKRGLSALSTSRTLETLAQRLADRMADLGQVDDQLLGGPVASLAVEDDASFLEVRSVVARLDDPLLLDAPEPALLLDMNALGVGLAPRASEGAFYVCVLVGEGAAGR